VLVAALAATPPAPEVRCTLTDPRLDELSGLVAIPSGLWAVADGGRRVEVHRLDERCGIAQTRTAAVDPYDAEDLARGPGDTLWVADFGDNQRRRDTVAVVVLSEDADPRLHRLSYPDGPRDAEALLVDAAGVPHVLTKDTGRAEIYRTDGPPVGPGPTPLVRAGEVVLPPSDTAGGPLGSLGSRVVTGAAVGPGVIALRTYTDAWLYPWSGGDLAAALRADPVRVPLPGEPQGEAVAFEPDGTLLSASETRDGRRGELRAVPGAAALVRPDSAAPREQAPQAAPQPARPEWFPAALGAAGAAGALALLAAAAALHARRRR